MRISKISVLTFLIFVSCKSPKDKNSHADNSATFNKASYFKNVLVKKFKMVDLPLTFRPSSADQSIQTDIKSADTLFLSFVTCYGLLPDTSKYYGLIWLGIADSNPPHLTTYNKEGEIIDDKSMTVGECGGDGCGWDCREFLVIDKEYNVLSIDTITISHCDSSFVMSRQITYKTGRINSNGKIDLTTTKKKDLR